MALTVKEVDKYAYTGHNWGIYDVFIDKWDGVNTADKNQRWMWKQQDNTLVSLGHEGEGLTPEMFEGMNGDLVTMGHSEKFAGRQKFKYDYKTKLF